MQVNMNVFANLFMGRFAKHLDVRAPQLESVVLNNQERTANAAGIGEDVDLLLANVAV